MKGHEKARFNLGVQEEERNNTDRALKHYMIAVECGSNDALNRIQQLCTCGRATKDVYAKALRAHQTYRD